MEEQNIHANSINTHKECIINCEKCGRPLSSPVSMEPGYGPKCWSTGAKVTHFILHSN